MNPNIIETNSLCRAFGSKTALADVSFRTEPGMILVLLGKNGAGKTTLMRLLNGSIQPTAGQAGLLGFPARALPDRLRRVIGWIGENPRIPGSPTVRECLELQAAADPDFQIQAAHELLTERDIPLDSQTRSLSKGQVQWLLAACALARPCKVLLFDEPAEGMDPEARRRFYEHVRLHVNRHASTAVISTHIIHDIEPIADEIMILHKGRLLWHEPLEAMRDQLRIVSPDALDGPLPGIRIIGTGPDGRVILRNNAPWPPQSLIPTQPFNLEYMFLALIHDPRLDTTEVPS